MSHGRNENKVNFGTKLIGAGVVAAGLALGVNVPVAQAAIGQYDNCAEAWADGRGDIKRGDSDYRKKLDRDDDGVACEWSKYSGERPSSQKDSDDYDESEDSEDKSDDKSEDKSDEKSDRGVEAKTGVEDFDPSAPSILLGVLTVAGGVMALRRH